ncbi:hypothetical protein APHMUC_0363 [Anaplasma phagocytophilum str. ApMUC09]|uniref:Uncharacterized protein n=1 Tax=Anaplasma phagocytophilum str. ApMUC09 TaxID=1359152 RepID=A0A0F3N9M9_ANAPH|nr:hypothetical protein APHMUC_0363 [Anaplasma phagocytophilum str. ApMUC09]
MSCRSNSREGFIIRKATKQEAADKDFVAYLYVFIGLANTYT